MRLGLTGGMGCGKSFILSCFAAHGWKTVETDAITRELLSRDAEVAAGLRKLFGVAVFDAEGKVDRAAIAKRVFGDVDALRSLESLIHPKVRAAWQDTAEGENRPVIVEIPLLFEKNLEKLFNLNVCVTASQTTQIERLAVRGFGKSEALARMARQLPLREKEQRADYVISNDGSAAFAQAQVAEIIGKIMRCRV
ncbi:MAG: dephospho-CoA kinase [Opitutales bacterium]|nr:dephospho-CoA kinase [Opitutales bacterium]